MAASSSLSSCMMHKEAPALNISKHPKDFFRCHWNISYKSPNYLKPISQRNRIQCQALKIENPSSLSVGQKFQLDDVIEAQQFDRDTLNAIFQVAREMENIEKNSPGSQLLKGYLMATLFYEPSTRTRLSFESAMKRLGGEVLTTENAREFSSAAKGETLEDTIRTVEGYSDIIVMRHFESGAARRAAATAGIPIINAGDGPGQHPTQALLDVYTIDREIGKLDGIKVALVGDLANGRTVRSLAYLLAKYNDVKIDFVTPDVVKMKVLGLVSLSKVFLIQRSSPLLSLVWLFLGWNALMQKREGADVLSANVKVAEYLSVDSLGGFEAFYLGLKDGAFVSHISKIRLFGRQVRINIFSLFSGFVHAVHLGRDMCQYIVNGYAVRILAKRVPVQCVWKHCSYVGWSVDSIFFGLFGWFFPIISMFIVLLEVTPSRNLIRNHFYLWIPFEAHLATRWFVKASSDGSYPFNWDSQPPSQSKAYWMTDVRDLSSCIDEFSIVVVLSVYLLVFSLLSLSLLFGSVLVKTM